MGVPLQRMHPPVQTFTVIPQSSTHLKLMFYNFFSLDIYIRAGSLVLVRDGAISNFDQRKVIEDLQPIPWLKTFLMRFVSNYCFFYLLNSKTL
jgi:mediator of RNA polymerase II transcription subunit 14